MCFPLCESGKGREGAGAEKMAVVARGACAIFPVAIFTLGVPRRGPGP
jgi:hypothetical protein